MYTHRHITFYFKSHEVKSELFSKRREKNLFEDGKRAQLFCLSSILDMTRQDTVDTPRGMDDERRNRKKLLLSLEHHP